MNQVKLPKWLGGLVASLGGVGLFIVAFLDSSVLSFPVVADFLVIEQSSANPARMPYYALMATVGSLAGCIWLYLLAKKGGEAMYRRHAGKRAERIRQWVERNAFASVAIPAILPPPMPFKPFILAAGVFQVRWRTFVLALVTGRGLRYFLEGILAIRYGQEAINLLMAHKLGFTLGAALAIVLTLLASRWIFRGGPSRD
jgi:membrane protein YqaA with SNARE-associated domain